MRGDQRVTCVLGVLHYLSPVSSCTLLCMALHSRAIQSR
ncbi:unnamed protein product [Staurois parvus]|uniref:Uncharacterized protein n=1 Tax=Staurois parvus TaxID=386267 RepID=A0ABN9F4P6_9NEOB|nr:unnamed protein product [Staurois parvus]